MKTLIEQIEELNDSGHYEESADLFLNCTNSTIKCKLKTFGSMDWDDCKTKRNVWNVTITSDNGQELKIEFGDSVVNSCKPKMVPFYTTVKGHEKFYISASIKGGALDKRYMGLYEEFTMAEIKNIHKYWDKPFKLLESVKDRVTKLFNKCSVEAVKNSADQMHKIINDPNSTKDELFQAKNFMSQCTRESFIKRNFYKLLGAAARHKMYEQVETYIESDEEKIPPSNYSILTCLNPYDVEETETEEESFKWFCDMFGYDTDSRQAYKTFKELKRQCDQLRQMYSSDELEVLSNIQ